MAELLADINDIFTLIYFQACVCVPKIVKTDNIQARGFKRRSEMPVDHVTVTGVQFKTVGSWDDVGWVEERNPALKSY